MASKAREPLSCLEIANRSDRQDTCRERKETRTLLLEATDVLTQIKALFNASPALGEMVKTVGKLDHPALMRNSGLIYSTASQVGFEHDEIAGIDSRPMTPLDASTKGMYLGI